MADEINNINNAAELDWDAGISADASDRGQFNLPPVGEYGFTVVEFEKCFSKNGKKMAKINIELDESGQYFKVYDYLVLTANMEWKLAQFFESLGLKKKGEPLTSMPWDKVLGESGKVKIKHETYNGNENCKVDKYLAPSAPTVKAPAPAQNDMPFEV